MSKSIAAILVAGILSAGVWAFLRWRESTAAARIPPPPAASSKAVAAHLAAKYEAARDQPTSPALIGALCVAYHADMFFEEADRCYALVSELDPSQWRWRYYRALIQAERGGGEPLVENLRAVVAQAPDFGPAWQRLGDALFKAGRYDEAARHGSERVCPVCRTPISRHHVMSPKCRFGVRQRGPGANRARRRETPNARARSSSASRPTRRNSARRCGCSPTSIDRSAPVRRRPLGLPRRTACSRSRRI